MEKLGKGIVKHKTLILLLGILLLIPSALGYLKTRVNYDILSYLPGDIETMKGQDILVDEFGTGAFSMIVLEGMDFKDVSVLKAEMEQVDHVKNIIWYDTFADISIPVELLPDKIKDAFINGDCTLMAVIFDTTMSADETMDAIEELRALAGKQCFISGMSAVVTDTKNLSDKETPIYVCIAVLLSSLVLGLTMDSYLIPLMFLLSIGMAIIYNLGSNIFLGEISYITKALSAVLQLGVTMDYSIFLWHSYQECLGKRLDAAEKENGAGKRISDKEIRNDAMAEAIAATITSVVGSSITTVAGFIALCFMSFTLGMDLGVVMAKGVVFGVIACVTILPSMILFFDKGIQKTRHRPLLPKFTKLPAFVSKHYGIILILFVIIWVPAIYGNQHAAVYYNLDETLPKNLASIMANQKLNDTFEMNSTHMLLIDSQMEAKKISDMTDEIKEVAGVKSVIGLDAMMGSEIPRELLPEKVTEMLVNENYEMMLVSSEYKVASDEVNDQCEALNKIIKSYDPNAMLVGEAPCTKDLIEITDQDFKTVNFVSIGVILLIILIVFRSVSLPVILVLVIEFAIYINMGIPYFTNTEIPFIASIVIGTIQLGSTVDYAILMTTRYKLERHNGADKKEAVRIAHSTSIQSIVVSALSFFAATFGVGVYSDIDMISSLCTLMARGALISMVVVLLVLPAMYLLLDKVICTTSIGFKSKK
ncbi:MAG: MMPL family transporter [Eubacteriales bacterium]|nr:MMPL family transporter [Eubacteriales bacterium]